MADVMVRPYRPTDLEACRALWVELTQHHRQIYQDPFIGGDDPGRHFDRHLAQVGEERIWVAECAGAVVGLVGLILRGSEAEIEPVMVAAQWHGRGIGRMLLERVEEEARRLGVRFLTVAPVVRNVEAISLFHRYGFRLLGSVEVCKVLTSAEADRWKTGLELWGHLFDY